MKILTLNCGSSSIKFQLIDMTVAPQQSDESVIAKGLVEKIGSTNAGIRYQPQNSKETKDTLEILDHRRGIAQVVKKLTDPERGVIEDLEQIAGIGHRVVHGGERFSESTLINEKVLKDIEACIELAPLHNPHNLQGILACQELMPKTPQVAVFDTAFHQKMPPYSYIYAIPYKFYKRYSMRRYGFHGTSHRFVAEKAATMLGKELKELKLITCHLGNGASIAAVCYGISVDTSMGFTPLEGLVMGTRCGDLDPAIIPFLMTKEGLSNAAINMMMNKHSGLFGISGLSGDMRVIQDASSKGDEQAKLALEVFCYRIKKYIGAYIAAMNGLDALIFTGGIGENSAPVRKLSTQNLDYLGITIDDEKNNKNELSLGTGKVAVFAIPTNEELAIARETAIIISK